MAHYREDHLRILTWIVEQRWHAFSSEDECLIRACVYSGLIVARRVRGQPGKTRLILTPRAEHYLDELRSVDTAYTAVDLEPSPCRRAFDRATDQVRSVNSMNACAAGVGDVAHSA